ncbi:MAG: 2-hydroxyacyl-CoA dehydratase [Candidatus Lokiarchaeota archaeon]|nr:2-hydroxyacyl-CoA dehydratase [Candidatus Lokiarchaeota archaeon]
MTRRLKKSAKSLKELMNQYYTNNHVEAKKGKFVVWIAIIVPVELLKGFDIVIAVPENHSAMCAAKGVGATQCQVAENHGYSMDLCSYARIDLGTWFVKGKGSPSMGLPKPDLLISNNNNCSLLVKWFDVYSRELNIPHYILDVPFCYEKQDLRDLEYIIDQYHELIDLIEDLTGQKFNIEKVKEAIKYSNEAVNHWKRFLDFASNHPSGITAFDSFLHMAIYITSYRGAPEAVRHFKLLADETEELVRESNFPVPNEKYRLLWDNIAPWHQLRNMSTRLVELQANIVYATYTSCLGTIEGEINQYVMDPNKPLYSLARIQNCSVCPYGLNLRFKAMSKMIEKYDIDGIVFTSNRSCKVYSVMQLDLQKRIVEKFNIPTAMIDVDHADERKYDQEGAFLRLEALLEEIDS